ncbi:DUF4126 domain-containing protein [Deltaproteobacteria bacterium IMCC39524]|nr:DUF4126 domain-containing protein [Deltaproteobacteria bacterium IMCC39524]
MQEILPYIALSMGVAWASGINLYAAILVLGLLGLSGNVPLPETLQVLQNPIVIGVAGFMYCVEFFADKIQGVDSAWDTLHTFIRIPAGAVLAATAVGDVDPAIAISAALVGGGLTAGTHLAKTSTRLLVNTSPEPFSNIGASLVEDTVVVGGLLTALYYPFLFLLLLVAFVALMIWLLPILIRALKGIFDSLKWFFRGRGVKRLPEG